MMHTPIKTGDFPGDWSYHGNAKLLLKDCVQLIRISLYLTVTDYVDISVKIIWSDISDNEIHEITTKMIDDHQQFIIIQESILLIGCSIPPLYSNDGTTDFDVVRFVTYSENKIRSTIQKDSEHFVSLRAYLNDEVSLHDKYFITEFQNMPSRKNRTSNNLIGEQNLYCALNSGYSIRCGKKYIAHKNHNVFYNNNIDTLYKLSFIDVKLSLINNLGIDDPKDVEIASHLENVLNDTCAFLSIICVREILPIYYDYSIFTHTKYIDGYIIPVWGRRKIQKNSNSSSNQGINFLNNAIAFLECCPINKQLSRGIQHLKLTVYESSVELKLMASCSAIEYFYSFWFQNMDGLLKIVNESSNTNPLLNLRDRDFRKLREIRPKTPFLSMVIRFFVNDLSIDWAKYMNADDTPMFIKVRNDLLHGNSIYDDTLIFQAEEVAQKLATAILFSIMKRNSRADVSQLNELYETLPIRTPEKDFHTISDGWAEIKNILDKLV